MKEFLGVEARKLGYGLNKSAAAVSIFLFLIALFLFGWVLPESISPMLAALIIATLSGISFYQACDKLGKDN